MAIRVFASVLIALVFDVASLFAIFNFVAVAEISISTGVVLFILSTVLLLLGYMLGIVVVGFLAIFVLTRFWSRAARSVAG